jgi:hypothetical protein
MTETSFARVPHAVYDALERGEITPLQFDILSMLHRAAEHHTGIVRSWSATEFLYRMGKPDLPSLKTVKRAMQELRGLGWYSDDYLKGSKRPYNVTLHNFVAFGPVQENDHENNHGDDQEHFILNPHAIKTCCEETLEDDHEESHRHGHDSDHDVTMTGHGQMSLKDQIRSRSSAAQAEEPPLPAGSAIVPPSAGASGEPLASLSNKKTQRLAHEILCDRLRAILHWLPDDIAPAVAKKLLTRYTANHIVAAVKHGLFSYRLEREPKEIKKLFADDGAWLEICIGEYQEWLQVRPLTETDQQTIKFVAKYGGVSRAVVEKQYRAVNDRDAFLKQIGIVGPLKLKETKS